MTAQRMRSASRTASAALAQARTLCVASAFEGTLSGSENLMSYAVMSTDAGRGKVFGQDLADFAETDQADARAAHFPAQTLAGI